MARNPDHLRGCSQEPRSCHAFARQAKSHVAEGVPSTAACQATRSSQIDPPVFRRQSGIFLPKPFLRCMGHVTTKEPYFKMVIKLKKCVQDVLFVPGAALLEPRNWILKWIEHVVNVNENPQALVSGALQRTGDSRPFGLAPISRTVSKGQFSSIGIQS